MLELTAILARLEPLLGPRRGTPQPLDGGITNRNYRVTFGERDCVVRLPGKDTALLGIDREAERLAAQAASRLGIGPELLHADADCSVTAFALTATRVDPLALKRDPAPFARALRAFHDSALALPARFWVPDLLDRYAELLARRDRTPPPAFERARVLVQRVARRLPLDDPVPCHNDLLNGNLLIDASGEALLVDWEYAGIGHRLFDLANLAVNNEFDEDADARLLAAYYGAPATQGRRAALTLMKLVSDAREAAWGVVQQAISELDVDFGGYATEHFERLERAAANPRLKEYLEHAATA